MPDTQENHLRSAIPARSKRTAMDWSLVLASQGIEAIINRTDNGWELVVEPAELERARASLAQYQLENRGWNWRHEWASPDLVFHWGAVFWVFWMVAFYYWNTLHEPWCKSAGMVNNQAVLHGAWWRLFTGITLHENLPHLLSNSATGFLLLGLAMARFGPGITLLVTFLAGAVGNLASVLAASGTQESLGASGMVTAALGLITVQTLKDRRPGTLLPRGVAAGLLILVLISFSPGSDMVAHVGGFAGGAVLGLALAWIQPAKLRRPWPNVLSAVALATLVLATWILADRS